MMNKEITLQDLYRPLLAKKVKEYEQRIAHWSNSDNAREPCILNYTRTGYNLLICEEVLKQGNVSRIQLYQKIQKKVDDLDEDMFDECSEIVRRYAELGGRGLVKRKPRPFL